MSLQPSLLQRLRGLLGATVITVVTGLLLAALAAAVVITVALLVVSALS